MGSWVHDKVHVKSLDFFEPCAKAAKNVETEVTTKVTPDALHSTLNWWCKGDAFLNLCSNPFGGKYFINTFHLLYHM